ncbi:MAG: hypothetical protein E6970_07250 [Peptostreptococcus sp.]|nr:MULTISPECIES: hypothetical protein [Peptostreptococcus]MBS5596473.1 hypothetical protein [Peptostreptococcus sp.]MDU1175101.1 hypothetical protein [Peptostreptococcus anaerobius]MDU1233382.1 hypothetical protein [Peptostreptococcus anaerobius]MDU1265590.1 hypothetical protein [Peptostreptococcus sp.]
MKKRIVLAMVVMMGIFAVSPLSDAVNRQQEDMMYARPAKQDVVADSDDTVIDNESPVSDKKKEDIVEADTSLKSNQMQDVNKVRNQDRVINKVEVNKSEKTLANNVTVNKSEKTLANNVTVNKSEKTLANNVAENKTNKIGDLTSQEAPKANKSLNREEALNVLKNQGTNLDYSYMGDEKDYSVLKEKGHEGYVFLPNTNTDMGLFVDKNTKEVYYFHPSGYIDQY